MRMRNLAVTATLIPVLMVPGCSHAASEVAASGPRAKKAVQHDSLADQVSRSGSLEAPARSSDPVVNAYYDYRVALDVMMRSGGRKARQLEPVMTPRLFQSISAQARYYRNRKLHNTGATRVIWAKRTLASNGVIVSACYDTAAARTVDASGRSVLPASTPTRWLDQMRVKQLQGRWVVDGGSTTPNAC
jgi:hypothetical protein